MEITRFMNRSLAHVAHLAYLEGALQTHQFVVQLAAVAVYLARSDSDVSLSSELAELKTLIDTVNEAEDGARTVHLELAPSPVVAVPTAAGASADATPADVRVRRGSVLRALIDRLYGGQIARDLRQLHLLGRYCEDASCFRLTCREVDIAFDAQTWRNPA